jgi:hypothetical protein
MDTYGLPDLAGLTSLIVVRLGPVPIRIWPRVCSEKLIHLQVVESCPTQAFSLRHDFRPDDPLRNVFVSAKPIARPTDQPGNHRGWDTKHEEHGETRR